MDETKLKKSSSLAPYFMAAMAMGAMSNAFMGNNKLSYEDELSGIDNDLEYELIQQKKSRLSKRLREKVIFRYERNKS